MATEAKGCCSVSAPAVLYKDLVPSKDKLDLGGHVLVKVERDKVSFISPIEALELTWYQFSDLVKFLPVIWECMSKRELTTLDIDGHLVEVKESHFSIKKKSKCWCGINICGFQLEKLIKCIGLVYYHLNRQW
jgi:hypothetical protein